MKQISTRTAHIHLDRNDIVIITIKKNAEIDFEDAADNFLVIKHMVENKPCLRLIDARGGFSMDKKAKTFLESKDVKERTRARAIVVHNKIKKVLLNFLYTLETKKVPTQVFTDYDGAYEWLMNFKPDHL